MIRFLTVLFVLSVFISCSGEKASKTEAQEPQQEETNPMIVNEKLQMQVGYLKLSNEELAELPPQMQNLYASIVQNTNYASGISISNILTQVNDNLNRVMDSDTLVFYEQTLIDYINVLKVNPRKASTNFNMAGRWLLRKTYEIQVDKYPSLSGQVSTLKENLGQVRTRLSLIGQEQQVRDFIDQAFIVIYLMDQEDLKNQDPVEQ